MALAAHTGYEPQRAEIPRRLPSLPTHWPAKPTLSWGSVKVMGLPVTPLLSLVPTSATLRLLQTCPLTYGRVLSSSHLFLGYCPRKANRAIELKHMHARRRGHCQESRASGGARMPCPALRELQPSGCRASSCLCSLLVFPLLVRKLFVVLVEMSQLEGALP